MRTLSRAISLVAALAVIAAATGCRMVGGRSQASGDFPALDAIEDAVIAADLGVLAGDAMRGREAGTLDELRASAWLAERARAYGLEPAGDHGSWFQFFTFRRIRTSDDAVIEVAGRRFALWTDAVTTTPATARVGGTIVWAGDLRGDALARLDARGRVIAAALGAPDGQPPVGAGLSPRRYTRLAITQRTREIAALGPSAILLVSDSIADGEYFQVGSGMRRGSYGLDTGVVPQPAGPPVIWLRRGAIGPEAAGRPVRLELTREISRYPSVNVVARVPGSDASVRGEHVLFSAHQDHDGVRHVVDGDSIWNGADDNASGSVAILAVGRALARAPARRSALFVWHGAEERGLLGSRWHAMHPVVPRASIVAVLNADMVGRNHPDTAALLGSQPPHRNSPALAAMALDANERVSRFAVDSSWDRPDHPEGFYFRSDHAPYARAGIPALFFTTVLHPDYHTPRDEAARIDVAKLARVARWMYATGWLAGNGAERPRVDPASRLQR